jgi:hypothetical protein
VKTPKVLAPKVKITRDENFVRASWKEQGTGKAFWFVVYVKDKNGWGYSVLPAAKKSIAISADRKVEKILVTSIDRVGNGSPF